MSLGHTTSESDIDRAINALVGVVRQLRRNKVKA
jgi:cysteine sulfinate desulfinase/cysteine desulfurase-like protein